MSAIPTGDSAYLNQPRIQLDPGQKLGDYELVRILGEGGFGQVWESVDVETGRRVALKVLATQAASGEALDRFRREGKVAASLNHPNCVYVFSADDLDGHPAIAMELIRGGTLQDRLRDGKPLPVAEAVDLTLDLLDGLEAAHEAGILHRDIKPSNCFIDADGRALLGDFGLSRTLEQDADLTVVGRFMGSPFYASPEQVRGRDVDARSDIYSLGATLYRVLTGKPPFDGSQIGEVLARILSEEPTPLEQLRDDVPVGLRRVVNRMLAKEPERRYPTCAAVRQALTPFASAGLTPGALAKRASAFAIDFGLIYLMMMPIGLLTFSVQSVIAMLPVTLLSLSVVVGYFTISEGRYGASLGKRVVGLRVANLDGTTRDLGRVLRRSLWFALFYSLPGMTASYIPFVFGHDRVSWWVLQPIIVALLFLPLVSMRRGNGYAVLHELLSKTRVREAAESDAAFVPVGQLRTGSASSASSFGPFVSSVSLWSGDDDALVVAHDEALDREVWIHEFRSAGRAQSLERQTARTGRLRWLQGHREGPKGWDAYELPAGASLRQCVAERPLSWKATRRVMHDLATQLAALAGEEWAERRLSIDHVWLDRGGRALLLDFPVSRDGATEFPLERSRAFLQQTLLFALEGQLVPEDRLSGRTPRQPLPEHARDWVERTCGVRDEFGSSSEIAEALGEQLSRPAEIGFARMLLGPVAFSLPFVFMLFGLAMLVFFLGQASWTADVMMVQMYLDEVAELRQEGAEPEKVEAIRLILGTAYVNAQENPTGAQLLAQQTAATIAEMSAAAESYPAPSDEEIAAARVLVKEAVVDKFTSQMRRGGLPGMAIAVALLSLVAILSAALFRGPPLLRLCGVLVQTADGRRAGRGKCLWRAILAWSPCWSFLVFAGAFSLFREQLPLETLTVLAGLFVLLAMVLAMRTLSSGRVGLHDRIAGTRLTPR